MALSCLLAGAALTLTACSVQLYKFPQYTFADRPIPPSKLANRVLVAIANPSALASGKLQILDAYRDIRNNIQNTVVEFDVSGFAANRPNYIENFPVESRGYVYGSGDGSFNLINYGTEQGTGAVPNMPPHSDSITATEDFFHIYAATTALGIVTVNDTQQGVYILNIPGVSKIVANPANTVVLALVTNANTVYRIVKLNSGQAAPPGFIDCEPQINPVYCALPVTGTFDRPTGGYFSLDGSQVYLFNCGPECGGTRASISFLSLAPLIINNIPTSAPYPTPVVANVAVPGGVTVGVSDGTTLYLAGQQLHGDGYFAGNLSLINLASLAVTNTYSIADGNHTRILLADDNTLWIGSSLCATGERAHQAALGVTTQAANYNCLTRFVIGANPILPAWSANTAYAVGQQVTDGANIEVVQTAGTSGATTPSWKSMDNATTDGTVVWVNLGTVTPAQIIPGITPNNPTAATNVVLGYPNSDNNQYYYGDASGVCWVEYLHKVYTAYGGQVHAFNTIDGSEINNMNITVAGTALDVAYMDATTDSAN